jgi:ATP-dependent DNA helicase DinG
LKGRANYACLHRVRDGVPDEQGELIPVVQGSLGGIGTEVVRARAWAEEQASTGATGDRDRLEPGVSDRAWSHVSVTARECLGAQRCRYATECFAERARARAGDVDVLVTNHALLAIDAIEGLPVLPEHDVVVVDEGHELAARFTGVATADLSAAAVDRAARRSRSFAGDTASGQLADAAELLRRELDEVEPGRLDELPAGLHTAVAGVRDASRAVRSGFASAERDGEHESGRRAAKAAVDDVFDTAERMAAHDTEDVVWVEERDRGARLLRVAPLSVAGLLRDRLFSAATVVATSATMELGGSFEPVARSLGLVGEACPDWRGLDVGSPFDYARQAILYVGRDLPPPGREGLRPQVVDALAELIAAAGGRTLGLFSSRRAATEAADAVRARLPEVPVLCQGDDVVPTLVRRFIGDDRTCLFGTLSLWQGVDVPGGACQLVVIDRLPFPRPDEPLMSARQRAVERAGGNGFMSVAATHAALLLAQGAGRLIRRSSDRGVVAVLDPRLVNARYAGFLRASLPPMWFTTDRDVVVGALKRLATPAGVSGSAEP